jgi:6-phosphofructokinase
VTHSPRILVGQSGGPTAVINASLAGVISTAYDVGAQVFGMANGIQGLLANHLVDLNAFTPQNLELLKHTPASYLGSCRYKLPDLTEEGPGEKNQAYEAIFEVLARQKVDAVCYIGGNDSMDTIAKLGRWGAQVGSPIRFVGVPKTIDNDLVATDHTPGYGSAAKYIATTVHELALDSSVYDLPNVLVVEIMGRDAGWLAAASALARTTTPSHASSAPDIILLPEAPIQEETLIERVKELLCQKHCVVIAASEGARRPDGSLFLEGSKRVADSAADSVLATDAFGHATALSGCGRALAALFAQTLNIKTRAVELNTSQRAASHLVSATDLREAEAMGVCAIKAALQGKTRVVPTMERVSNHPYQVTYNLTDIEEVANKVKFVPTEWIAPDGMDVCPEFIRYARPLILGESWPAYVDGIPATL